MIKKAGLLPPFMFGFAPALFLYLHNPGQILARELLIPAGAVLLISALTYLLFGLIQGQSAKASVLTSLTMILFFSYGPLQQWVKTLPNLTLLASHRIFLPLVMIVPSFLCFAVKNSKSNFERTERFTLLACLFLLVLFLTIHFFQKPQAIPPAPAQSSQAPALPSIPLPKAPVDERPDIYYIILDGYLRPDALKQNYGFNDDSFINSLKELGFYVAGKSTSNYAWTPLSMAASLNMTYLDELAKSPGPDSRDFTPLRNMITQNRLASFLRRIGYTYATFSTGYTTLDHHQSDLQIKPTWLPDDFQVTLLRNTPLAYLLELFEGPHLFYRERLMHVFKSLPQVADMPQPTFAYAHIMAPHYPFLFNRQGQPLISRTNELWNYPFAERYRHAAPYLKDYRKDYAEYVAFTNSQILKVLRGIFNRSSKPPIIILQSDHGAAFSANFEDPSDTEVSERMSILNAYYVPQSIREKLYPEITPVNSFRIILDVFFHTNLERFEDVNFYSDGTYPYRFKNVTEILKSGGIR